MAHDEALQLVVPTSVVTYVDVAHLGREIEAIDAFLQQAQLRKAGESVTMPKLSAMLGELAQVNQLNLLDASDRAKLLQFIQVLKKSAPVIHVSFAAEPSLTFLYKLCAWFRKEVSPHTLLHVGLQPSIAAGCIVRTNSKYFDFSLRQHLTQQKPELAKILGGKE